MTPSKNVPTPRSLSSPPIDVAADAADAREIMRRKTERYNVH